MFNVNNVLYTVRFDQKKFNALGPRRVAEILAELLHTYDSDNKKFSNESLKTMFLIGLENESTGKAVKDEEAQEHYERVIKANGIEPVRQVVMSKFFMDMPAFTQAIKRSDSL